MQFTTRKHNCAKYYYYFKKKSLLSQYKEENVFTVLMTLEIHPSMPLAFKYFPTLSASFWKTQNILIILFKQKDATRPLKESSDYSATLMTFIQAAHEMYVKPDRSCLTSTWSLPCLRVQAASPGRTRTRWPPLSSSRSCPSRQDPKTWKGWSDHVYIVGKVWKFNISKFRNSYQRDLETFFIILLLVNSFLT